MEGQVRGNLSLTKRRFVTDKRKADRLVLCSHRVWHSPNWEPIQDLHLGPPAYGAGKLLLL